MLEPILQTIRDVEGVQGAMVVDRSSAIIAQRAHAIYDIHVLQQVARAVTTVVDSVQLVQDDWDVLTSHYADGKLLLRNLRIGGAKPRRYVLTVIADTRLNVAFLGVALRVAAGKLLAELEAGPPVIAAPGNGAPSFPGNAPPPADPLSESSRSGLSWSGVGSSSSMVGSGSQSGMGRSDVGVADANASAFLTACTKALAASVGPMAKVFVKDAVRKLCGDRPFSRADAPALIAHLAAGLEDADDRAAFQRATRSL
jgi:predicted regulator of Ras-like GTPase activity (Roadblock/LC7/MglB family)